MLVLEPLEPNAPTIHMPPHMRKLLIGRDHNADVVIDHSEISRRQCEIERVDDAFVVRDLGSTNGTRVNGVVVTEASTLAQGDVLELARSVSYRRR
jgi:pSer/pThr/pTyr-binding forkhead associated (FHA) protein